MIGLAAALTAAALQPPAADERFHILQLGDSHTAGDAISGPLRRHLQTRFGEGGRGVLPPGRPYPGYLTHGVTAAQSGSWAVSASFGPGFPGIRPVGLSGYTLTSQVPGASLGVTSDDAAGRFDRITVCALKEPGAGAIRLRIGAEEESWELASHQQAPACRSLQSPTPASAASLTAEDARSVSITSIATFQRARGVALSNLGVSGTQVVHLGRQSEAIVRAEIEAYRPDLIVLAFGTNEAFSPGFDAAAYEAGLRSGIARLRRLAGADVPILLVAPPDAATRNAALAGVPVRTCAPGLLVPAALAEVRERQRRVASELRLGFVDAGAAMGGPCSSLAWRRRGWMRGDLVHFTRAGGEQIGIRLAASFLALVR